MGHQTTRKIRLYPKNGDIESIDIDSFLKEIEESVFNLSDQIVCSVNEDENCYDVAFTSSKLSGTITTDKKTTILWDLLSIEEAPTRIGDITKMSEFSLVNYETAVFRFDEILFRGEQLNLNDFYEKMFPNWSILLREDQILQNESYAKIPINGYYTASNQHDIGDRERRLTLNEKINRQSENHHFHNDINECEIFTELLQSDFILKAVLKFIKSTEELYNVNNSGGLTSIDFYFEGRIVKSLKWSEYLDLKTDKKKGVWNQFTADWWDNCTNTKYKEFQKKMKEKTNNM